MNYLLVLGYFVVTFILGTASFQSKNNSLTYVILALLLGSIIVVFSGYMNFTADLSLDWIGFLSLASLGFLGWVLGYSNHQTK